MVCNPVIESLMCTRTGRSTKMKGYKIESLYFVKHLSNKNITFTLKLVLLNHS